MLNCPVALDRYDDPTFSRAHTPSQPGLRLEKLDLVESLPALDGFWPALDGVWIFLRGGRSRVSENDSLPQHHAGRGYSAR